MAKPMDLAAITRTQAERQAGSIQYDERAYGTDRRVWDSWDYRTIDDLLAIVRQQRVALERLEWNCGICPACGQLQRWGDMAIGHHPACWLADVLALTTDERET